MLKQRLIYTLLIVAVIIAGLASRRATAIPLWVGDLFWALMVYLIVRFLFIQASIKKVAIISLTFCFAIEFSQLYHAPWIDALRQTLFGKLVLGSGFLWVDLLAYVGGVAIGIIGEHLALKEERGR